MGVCLHNTNDVKMVDNQNVFFVRVVFPEVTSLRYMLHFMTFKGLAGYPGSGGYSRGTGGIMRHRLCNVDSSGYPILSSPLADVSQTPLQGVALARQRYNTSTSNTVDFIPFATLSGGQPITVQPGVMYASVITNDTAVAGRDFFSLEVVRAPPAGLNIAQAGNYVNEDPTTAPPSSNGMDHRMVVGWRKLTAEAWRFGAGVGGPSGTSPANTYYGAGFGYYDGTGGGGIALPGIGWETAAGVRKCWQPYNAYSDGTAGAAYTVNTGPAPKAVTHQSARATTDLAAWHTELSG